MKVLQKRIPLIKDIEGRITPPLVLWLLGVPGSICVALWFFFGERNSFRGDRIFLGKCIEMS